ncbi:peptidoglycan recognition family protein [Nonomuraea salmonea]|uniref:Peptidoglycan recognition family protein n=1 Tax=Nonomuraea salmonea TaxID=46181 RepID=A0ABV5P368_9ACTN
MKIHYTGGKVSPKLVDDHDRCVALVRSIQSQHQKGNGWIDIGYTYAVCPHRHIFVGRGAHHLPAANGPGLNSGHYAVLALVGSSGLVKPPPLMLAGIWDAITYLRKHGGAGKEIKGHRDGYATECPGPWLTKWIAKGAPKPDLTPKPKPDPKPEPVPVPEPEPVPEPVPVPEVPAPEVEPVPECPGPDEGEPDDD